MTHAFRRFFAAVTVATFATPLAPAQVKEPARADKMDVQIRYRIRADRDERIRQFRVLEKHLAGLGFVDARRDDPDRDLDILDPNAERFVGTIPGKKVLDVLSDVRVQNIVFAPTGFTYPDAPEKPVAVRIGLRTGLLGPVQQQLHRQTVEHLGLLGFSEALGYDTFGYTIVRGVIPNKNLNLLVKDVRGEPSGWFLTAIPIDKLPVPLRDRNPLRWTEVLPVTDFPAPYSPAPVIPAQLRYTPELRAVLLDPAMKDTPVRVEAIFDRRVDDIEGLRGRVAGRYIGASVDGVIGNVMSIRFPRPAAVETLSLEPEVVGVRLPRQATETVVSLASGKGVSPADALKSAGLDQIHKLGYTGAGVKVVLIGSDFSGAEKLIGTELPKRTRIVDLTTELTPDLLPAKTDPTRAGSGTAAAKALAVSAPGAELVLVRIDPGCYFHLYTITRLVNGELEYTDALRVRLAEITTRSKVLDSDRNDAITAYKAAYGDLSDTKIAVDFRAKAKADLDAVYAREKELAVFINRFNSYQRDITTVLRGARVIVNTLVWESGYPLDAINEFAGTLDTLATPLPQRLVRPNSPQRQPLVWVQAASNAGAAVWGGPFLDANRDGVMEFVPPGTKLPADDWSPQLNFLGTRNVSGDVSPELAKDAKLRIVVQWRESASPQEPESVTPKYALTLRLLQQLDPMGEKRASDDLAEVARSQSVPNVIYRTTRFLVFEQILEVTVPAVGRYALMIETGALPVPLLPALRRDEEIYPRVVIETLGTATSDPRAVFRSFSNQTAGVGTPGDALGAITVGSDATGAQTGGGTGLLLRGKPDVLGPAAFALGGDSVGGPGPATGFAGGAAAVLLQARTAPPNVFFSAGIEPGKKLVIPAGWLKFLPPVRP
ncbi:hypothetical protein [Frigoriglobus tundricola]|uniref:Uncharacterized protein n=1 Tax=Frigoriglobus tundricola TaxID=2774151 RepID=A0A6M5Z4A7_9BACT|nr:hypothetical protein [Frigoriglobus tundricola]QJX00555.1 hypothetical protein FTUN_8185 [Frigoriglobus tundricola]